MNLVQKLPIGLSVVGLLFISSCSKEDLQTPEPEVSIINQEANMRGGLVKIAYLAPTTGSPGEGLYPKDWGRHSFLGVPPAEEYPSGISSLTHLFGDISLQWINPLQPIPGVDNMNSCLTTSTRTDIFDETKMSIVKTKIKNLSPNNMYKFTYYVATGIPFIVGSGNMDYANRTLVKLVHSNGSTTEEYKYLSTNPTQWKMGTITFTATGNEAELQFSAATSQPDQLAFAHLFIDKHSIKKL